VALPSGSVIMYMLANTGADATEAGAYNRSHFSPT